MQSLRAAHCKPRKGKDAGVSADEAKKIVALIGGWSLIEDGAAIAKEYRFEDFFHTIAFVNAVAAVANREDHHPDLEVGYSRCRVRYSTHDVGGLSMNDFISAAKIDDLATGAR